MITQHLMCDCGTSVTLGIDQEEDRLLWLDQHKHDSDERFDTPYSGPFAHLLQHWAHDTKSSDYQLQRSILRSLLRSMESAK